MIELEKVHTLLKATDWHFAQTEHHQSVCFFRRQRAPYLVAKRRSTVNEWWGKLVKDTHDFKEKVENYVLVFQQ